MLFTYVYRWEKDIQKCEEFYLLVHMIIYIKRTICFQLNLTYIWMVRILNETIICQIWLSFTSLLSYSISIIHILCYFVLPNPKCFHPLCNIRPLQCIPKSFHTYFIMQPKAKEKSIILIGLWTFPWLSHYWHTNSWFLPY